MILAADSRVLHARQQTPCDPAAQHIEDGVHHLAPRPLVGSPAPTRRRHERLDQRPFGICQIGFVTQPSAAMLPPSAEMAAPASASNPFRTCSKRIRNAPSRSARRRLCPARLLAGRRFEEGLSRQGDLHHIAGNQLCIVIRNQLSDSALLLSVDPNLRFRAKPFHQL